jgi:hypothetical protein
MCVLLVVPRAAIGYGGWICGVDGCWGWRCSSTTEYGSRILLTERKLFVEAFRPYCRHRCSSYGLWRISDELDKPRLHVVRPASHYSSSYCVRDSSARTNDRFTWFGLRREGHAVHAIEMKQFVSLSFT